MNDHIQYFKYISDNCLRCHSCHCYHSSSLIGKHCYGEIAEELLKGNTSILEESIFGCHCCGLCLKKCPKQFNAKEFMFHARAYAEEINNGLCHYYKNIRVDTDNNIFSNTKKEKNITYEDILQTDKECEVIFIPGCHMSTTFSSLTYKTYTFLKEKKLVDGMSDMCCGNPLYVSGQYDSFKKYVEKMNALYDKHHIKKIITPCPSCYGFNQMLQKMGYLKGIEICCLSDVLVKNGIYAKKKDMIISIHDSCPDRKNGIFSNSIRELYKEYVIQELPHIKENTICCGCGGLVPMYSSIISNEGKDMKQKDFKSVSSDACITTCFNCCKGLKDRIPIHHYLEDIIL